MQRALARLYTRNSHAYRCPAASLALAASFTSAPLLAAPATTAPAATKSQLHLQTFHPGPQAMFSVSSVLIEGRHDAILVNAQFGASDARKLVELIRASGKQLTTIYISHGDPDYYFGLATLQDAFPQARIVATAQTVAHIQQTQAGKLAYWGPKMGADVPARIVLPQVLDGDALQLEGQRLPLIGLDGPTRTARCCGCRRCARSSAAFRWWPASTCGWPTRRRRSRTPTGCRPCSGCRH
jgi:hypothetical protein